MPRPSRQPAGTLCLSVTVLAAVVYLALRLEFFALLASLGIGLLLAARFVGSLCLSGIEATIHMTSPRAQAGKPTEATVTLRNRNRFLPAFHPQVLLRESGSRRLQSFHLPLAIKAGASLEHAVAPILHERGERSLEIESLRSAFPFALFAFTLACGARSNSALVWPSPVPTHARLPSEAHDKQNAKRPRTRQKEAQPQPDYIRAYQAGDSRRSINWKLSAKLDQLTVITSAHDAIREFTLVADLRGPEWLPAPYFERSLSRLTWLVEELRRRQALRALVLNGKPFPLRAQSDLLSILDALSLVQPSANPAPPAPPTTDPSVIRVKPQGKGEIRLVCAGERLHPYNTR